MALGSFSDNSLKYVNVANGKMHFKDGDERKVADYIEGKIVGIKKIEDEFEGQPTTKVVVEMADGPDRYFLQFTSEAWFSVGFFARIGAVDLTRDVRIGVMPSEQNEKISFCWMKQGNVKIEANKETPRPTKVTVGKGKTAKVVSDYTEFSAFADKMIDDIVAKLKTPAVQPEQTAKPDDDLPF